MVKRILFSMALALLATFSLHADVLTVNDGTATNSYVPANGSYFDTEGAHSQSFFSSEQLDEIVGGTISGLTFYSSTSSTPTNWSGAEVAVKLVETTSQNLSAALIDLTSATTVATLAPSLVDGEFVITFSTPFSYQGGNLVIDIATTAESGYNSASWKGVQTTAYGRYATSATAAGTVVNFAPKTQFTFTPGAVATCAKPSSKALVSNVGSYGADVIWGAASGASQYQYSVVAAGSEADWTTATLVTDTFVTLSALNPNSNYTVYVRTYCGADDQSRAVSASFKTLCAPVTPDALGIIGFETSEGFESGSGKMENCWTVGSRKSTGTSYIPYVTTGTSYAFEGENSLRMYAYKYSTSTNNDSAYAVLPAVNFGSESITDYELVLYLRKSSTSTSSSYSYNDTLYVGTVSDAESFAGYTTIGHAVNTTTTYAKAVVSLENALSNNIVLLAACNNAASASTKYGSFYVDNVQIRKRSTCLTPVLDEEQTAVTSTTAYLAWPSAATPNSYRVMLSKSQTLRPDTITAWELDTTVYDANISLEDLTPATDYYVYLQAVCGDDDASDYSAINTFKTACAPVATLPYVEDFESTATGSSSNPIMPNCWDVINLNNGGNAKAYVYTSAKHNGSKGLYFSYTNAGNTYVLLPEFEMDLNTTQISFWYQRKNALSGVLTLGYFNGAEEDANFVAVKEFNDGTVNAWNEVSGYALTALPAGVKRIAFRHVNSAGSKTYNNTYFDDLLIEALPSCVKPTNVVVDSVSKNSVVLSWEGMASDYSVLVKNGSDTIFDGVVADTTLTISGLTHSTSYTFSVALAAICSATDTSAVLNTSVQFVTECELVTEYPWVCNFEAQTPNSLVKDIPCFTGFSKKGAGVDWTISAAGHNSSSTRCVFAKYSASSAGRTESNISLPEFYFTPGQLYEVSYWVKGSTYGTSDSLLVYVNDTILHKVNAVSEVGSSWIQVKDTLMGAGNTIISFGYQNLDGYSAYFDDVTVIELACDTVSNIHAADSTTTSVTLAWDSVPGASSYTVVVKIDVDTIYSGTVADAEIILNGLSEGMSYIFDVTVVASADHLKDSEPVVAQIAVSTKEPEIPTGLDAVATENKTIKLIRENQVYILRNGVLYDATGRTVEPKK